MSLDDVLTHAREMRFSGKSEQDLHQMLIICGNYTGQTSDLYSTNQVRHAIQMVQEELARRQRAKNHHEAIGEQQGLNAKLTEQNQTLHTETMGQVGKLKTSVEQVKASVDRLAGARWIDWAILIAGGVAAIAAVILLFR
jgi:hypothetical protein